jgi:sugar O-acyltransferase (sialic acid O-acetyltransferase NeuD family)
MNHGAQEIRIPLLNPNEPEAKIVHLAVENGQFVSKDSVLCILETTKSTAEVLAEFDGYVISLQVSENSIAEAGSLFCYLAESEDWQPDDVDAGLKSSKIVEDQSLPDGLRISKPALQLALSEDLDISQLPVGPMVTTKTVEDLLMTLREHTMPDIEIDPRKLVVYGGGGHGKSVIDTVRSQSIYEIYGVIDDGLKIGEQVLDLPVLGGREVLSEIYSQGIGQALNAVGGIGDIRSRISVFKLLEEYGFICPSVIHSSAIVESSAVLSSGVQIFPLAYIGSDVSVGFGCIINTSAIVSHDCSLANHVNISPGAVLAGGVEIGNGTLIGMGTTINLGVAIGENARIGNGATIKSDVPDGMIVKAGMIWPE